MENIYFLQPNYMLHFFTIKIVFLIKPKIKVDMHMILKWIGCWYLNMSTYKGKKIQVKVMQHRSCYWKKKKKPVLLELDSPVLTCSKTKTCYPIVHIGDFPLKSQQLYIASFLLIFCVNIFQMKSKVVFAF